MRKFYIITYVSDCGVVSGVVPSSVSASPNPDAAANATQIEDIKTSGYVKFVLAPGVWLRRASARKAAAELNSRGNGYAYSVREIGEFKRKVRPVKGYNIFRKTADPIFDNRIYVAGHAGPASEKFCGVGKSLSDDPIPTRAEARAIFAEQRPYHKDAYDWDIKLVTIYADA